MSRTRIHSGDLSLGCRERVLERQDESTWQTKAKRNTRKMRGSGFSRRKLKGKKHPRPKILRPRVEKLQGSCGQTYRISVNCLETPVRTERKSRGLAARPQPPIFRNRRTHESDGASRQAECACCQESPHGSDRERSHARINWWMLVAPSKSLGGATNFGFGQITCDGDRSTALAAPA